MHKLMIKLALLVFLFLPVGVQAQTSLHLSSASVDIWPEYDQAAVLVVTHITLAPEAALPVTLTLRIPADGQINAVAIIDPVKGLMNAPYDNSVQGNWSVLTITTNSLKVQVEYYEALNKNGTTRHIVYQWAGDNSVDTLDVNFLLPPGADHVTIDPAPVTSAPGQGGLTNYLVSTANLTTGQSFTLKIDYQRQTDELSIDTLPVQAVSTPGPNTPGRVSMPIVLPWVLAGIGVFLVVAGAVGFTFWKKGSLVSVEQNGQLPPHAETQTEVIYCHECGKRAQPGDVFCRTCGARLKQGTSE